MPDDCLACETPLGVNAANCERCGFPTALTAAAVIGLGRAGFPEPEPAVPRSGPSAAPPNLEPNPEELAIDHFARELRSALGLVRELGGDSADVVGELRQAALLQVEGQTSDTLAVLRGAQVRASSRVSELFDHRLRELEERQHALIRLGLATDLLQDTVQLRAEFAESPIPIVVEHLAEADRRLARTEAEWQELRDTMREIEQLRLAASKVGRPPTDADAPLARLRAKLDAAGVPRADVARLLSEANGVVQRYHEALAPHLQAELDQHASHLARFQPEHPPSRRARQMHAEANRHLRSGRLAEASFRVAELREAIAELSRPVPEAASEAAGAPVPATPPVPTFAGLLGTAREIAVRVKSLPADSPIAVAAGERIRIATEQLRKRQLQDAGRTLTELMVTLDRAADEEARQR